MENTFIELFSGIGGFRLGLERSGWTCLWANEYNSTACNIYRKNFGSKELKEGDINKIKTDEIPGHILLVGGFPCQPFSVAGKRKGVQEERGTLFTNIYRITKNKRPIFLLLENVEGLLINDDGRTFSTILQWLGSLGYILEWQVFNSKNHRVPQSRTRVFIIGHRRDKFTGPIFPVQTGTNPKTIQVVTQITGDTPSGLSRQSERIYDSRGLSPTLTASFSKPLIFDTRGLRQLTPIEYERLQGFPDNWTQEVSKNQRYKTLGNAVTVNVIEYLGKLLLAKRV